MNKNFDALAYFNAIVAKSAAAREFFRADAEIAFRNTGERFTRDEFIRMNCEYPGEWRSELERVERLPLASGESLVIIAGRVFSAPNDGKAVSCHVVSFIRLIDEKIAFIDEYWGDDGPPPDWRDQTKE